jgi:hypothetical protein
VFLLREGSFFFFCLDTKETKNQGSSFFCYKLIAKAKRVELAALKQQLFFDALHS